MRWCCLGSCSSSVVCHLIFVWIQKVLFFTNEPPHWAIRLWLFPNKVMESGLFTLRLCHNNLANRWTRSQQDSVKTRWQTEEKEHFLPSDTFKTSSQQDSVTTRCWTGEEEHFSPPDTFKTTTEQGSVTTRWQTGEEEPFSQVSHRIKTGYLKVVFSLCREHFSPWENVTTRFCHN